MIQCNQGGELAKRKVVHQTALDTNSYIVELASADSPSQNGVAETWNDTLAITVCTILYGSVLPANYWSAAMVHATYVHSQRVYKAMEITPYEG